MEYNVKQSESHNAILIKEGNRKRAASGRLSPRTLFGNLKVKRSFQEEEAVSRNLNNSRNSHGWKPPIKIDPNERSCNFSGQDCYMETTNHNYPYYETNLPPMHDFDVNEPLCTGSNEILYQKENKTDDHVQSDEPFPANSQKMTVCNNDFHNENHVMHDQELDCSEENTSHDIDDSENIVKQESDHIQIECRQSQEDPSYLEKNDFINDNQKYLKQNFSRESSNSQSSNCSRNESNFEKQNYNPIETLSQETVKLETDDLREYINTEKHSKDLEQEYSERSDSSKSTLDLIDSKNFPMEGNDDKVYKNILSQDKKSGNYIETSENENKEFYVTKGVNEPFDTGVTNSQFLQIENQISRNSLGLNMTNSYNSRPLLNNIETMKRYCSSLVAQCEWQKNVVKCITRDIDDLNKTIINVTGALKSLRKDNTSTK